MAKKFLGLSLFYWGLILLVVLFFVSGIVKVGISEGFAGRTPVCKDSDRVINTTLDTQKKCVNKPNKLCRWTNSGCYCCP
jgi:hypothetical protein